MFTFLGHVFAGLSPLATLAIGAAGSAALVALYLLRERQRRVLVAFVPLWDPSPGRGPLERLGRRLRRWLSLLLQLALLALLLLAAADPQPAASAANGRSLLVLVDRSASMRAREGDGSRLDRARAQARALVAGLGAGDRALVAGFARDVIAESGFESDRAALAAAIDRLEPSDEPGDLGRALAFAAAALRGRPGAALRIVSDGAFDEAGLPPVRWGAAAPAGAPPGGGIDLAGIDVALVPAGAPGDNVGILGFSARRRTLDANAVDVTVVVRNHGSAARALALEVLAGAGGRTIERLSLSLAPGETAARTLTQAFAREAELEARLVFPGGAGDQLALDDRAFALVPERPRRRVLVVGAPNLYLEGALLSFGDALEVRRVPAAAAEAMRAEWPSFDVVVFDGAPPPPAPRAGRYLYVDPHGPGSPWPERGLVRDPVASDFDRRHRLLAQLSLADLNIREARRLLPGGDDEVVASSLGTPLVLARALPGLKLVGLAFDVRRSDLPLRPTFPLLLANVFDWLESQAHEAGPTQRTGTTARLTVGAELAAVAVIDPAGRRTRHPAVAGAVDVPLPRQGIYRLVREGATTTAVMAANLASATESDTRRAPALRLGGQVVPIVAPPPPRGARDLALWALLLAAAISLLEWWTHHRRWTV